jgi:hypothetical protein
VPRLLKIRAQLLRPRHRLMQTVSDIFLGWVRVQGVAESAVVTLVLAGIGAGEFAHSLLEGDSGTQAGGQPCDLSDARVGAGGTGMVVAACARIVIRTIRRRHHIPAGQACQTTGFP